MINSEIRLKRNTHLEKGHHICIRNRYATSFPLHAHEFFEVEIVIGGNGLQTLNGVERSLERGSVTLITPADFHSVTIFPDNPLRVWNISFDETMLPEGMTEAFLKSSGVCRTVEEDVLKKIDTAAGLLLLESESNGFIRPITEYLLSLLTDIPENRKKEISPIREAILYIETHFRENPSLSQAAKRACLSTVYFGNLFKKTTGQTYISYLNQRKTDCAAMLLETGLSVTETCFASGFGSLSGFLHTFKKIKGISPDEYKKQTYENKNKETCENVHNK